MDVLTLAMMLYGQSLPFKILQCDFVGGLVNIYSAHHLASIHFEETIGNTS